MTDRARLVRSTALAGAGAGLDDVVPTTVHVASGDRRDLAAAWGCDALAHHDLPSTLLGVAALGWSDQLAALGGARADAMVLEGNDGAHRLWRAAGYAPQPRWRRWVEHLTGRSR